MDRRKTVTYIVFGLITIGIVADISNNTAKWIIPILVFGAIFALYKYPPKGYQKGKPWFTSFSKPGANKRTTKKAKFRVIDGNGKKSNGEDEPPRYH